MANNNLIEKIRSEILKSGFPLELRCRQEIFKHKWALALSRVYLDSDNIQHEIDLVADKQTILTINKKITVNSMIVLECKKNESNHWVFFDEDIRFSLLNLLSTLNDEYADNLKWLRGKSLSSHHYFKFKPTTSYCMAFKTNQNQIFEALNQVFNAYKHIISTTEPHMAKPDNIQRVWVNVYYPVIVLDGKLFVARLVNDNLEIEEVSQAVYVTHRPRFFKQPESIDIVTADALTNYLNSLSEDHNTVVSYIESLFS